jgi:hypothetical protein
MMTDATTTITTENDYEAKQKEYDRLTAEAMIRNKTAVFDALAAAGISAVTVTFDGESDNGQIQDVQATKDDAPIKLPGDYVACKIVRYGQAGTIQSPSILREALEALVYHFLETVQDGWENDAGAYGTFTLDVAD